MVYNVGMKKIGVLVYKMTNEYALDILSGIYSFFKDKDDVQVFVVQTNSPMADNNYYDYQSWTGVNLLFAEAVDAIIVITGSYASCITTEQMNQLLCNFKTKPIISISADINLPDSYYTTTNCETAYENAVSHLKNKHGCKKIAFFSANPTNSNEAIERFEAYKKALKSNGIKYDEKLVLHGNFELDFAIQVMQEKYPRKELIDFDSIICVNDLTALGCQTHLHKIGVNVPDEVKIIGYDDSSYAAQAKPRISTMNQRIKNQGYISAELIYKKLCGIDIPKHKVIEVKPIYKQSCGCIPIQNNDDIFRNSKDKLIHTHSLENTQNKMTNQYYRTLNSVSSIYSLLGLSQTTETIHRFANTLEKILLELDYAACMVCLYQKPVTHDFGKKFSIPSKAFTAMFLDANETKTKYSTSKEFNPNVNPFNDESFEKVSGIFILNPIFAGRKNYGYLVCKVNNNDFAMNSVSIKILVNTIAQNYEYTKSLTKSKSLSELNVSLQHSNSNLDLQSKTDELTKVLNRRGFMELGQKTLDFAADVGKRGVVFFGDLDGLKKINDTYGHDMGDEAIKAAAQVIAQSLRSTDTVARLSGDEFGAIAVGMSLNQEEKFRVKVSQFCEAISKDRNFPFTLSISIGAVEFNETNKISSLKELLSLADKKLYIEKRLKHSKR